MGRLNTSDERRTTLVWAKYFKPMSKVISESISLSTVRCAYDDELRKYFALACLSRSKTESPAIVKEAMKHVFQIRTSLEETIADSIQQSIKTNECGLISLFSGSFYGTSKKQGTSVRMPLTTCQPTTICKSVCYAHDALDAAPLSVIRGTVNGLIAGLYEKGDKNIRREIMNCMAFHTQKAIKAAKNELKRLPQDFKRRANIRFAHVGEVARFSSFSNDLARQVYDLSFGEVDCVVYTRHQNATRLDPDLFIINFTLDSSSPERRAWIPKWARVTYAAFGGAIDENVDVNFLEHHRWMHFEPRGKGKVCPATHPSTKVRSCDACRCDFCFTRHDIQHCEALINCEA